MSEYAVQVARAMLEIGAVGFSAAQPVTFKSGIISPVYVDGRTLPYHPAAWDTIIKAFADLIQTESLSYEVIAGVAMGGVPHSAALAFTVKAPSVFIRKEAKEHGKQQRVEGGPVTGKKVLLVEDMVTTGGSALSGVDALRADSALVTDMIAIVTYGFAELQENLTNANIHLHTLTNFSILMDEGLRMGKFSSDEKAIIADWFNDPHGWAERHHLT